MDKERELKIWHDGELKTEAQVWTDQSPYEIYRAACRRLDSPTGNDRAALRRRWPTLGDANRAMVDAYMQLSPDAKKYEDSMAFADLEILALG